MNVRKLIAAGGLLTASVVFAGSSWANDICAKEGPGTCNKHCEGVSDLYDPSSEICNSNPEIDGSQAGIALALILGIGLLVSERRRKPTA